MMNFHFSFVFIGVTLVNLYNMWILSDRRENRVSEEKVSLRLQPFQFRVLCDGNTTTRSHYKPKDRAAAENCSSVCCAAPPNGKFRPVRNKPRYDLLQGTQKGRLPNRHSRHHRFAQNVNNIFKNASKTQLGMMVSWHHISGASVACVLLLKEELTSPVWRGFFSSSTNSVKKTPPPVAVSKIDKKLEQYTHALEVMCLGGSSLILWTPTTNGLPFSSHHCVQEALVTFSNPQRRSGSFTEGKTSTRANSVEAYGGK